MEEETNGKGKLLSALNHLLPMDFHSRVVGSVLAVCCHGAVSMLWWDVSAVHSYCS